jgi:guanylate kinase
MTALYPLVVVSGPSGSGKSTVISRVVAMGDLPLRVSVSATTRPPRPGEIDGVHYHFWSRERFEDELRQKSFLEHALVHGHCYGTLRREVEPFRGAGRLVILEIDVQGADTVRNEVKDVQSIFLQAPSLTVYEERLRKRGTESEERIQGRLAAARLELERAAGYDHIVTNAEIDGAVREVHAILKSIAGDFCPCSMN